MNQESRKVRGITRKVRRIAAAQANTGRCLGRSERAPANALSSRQFFSAPSPSLIGQIGISLQLAKIDAVLGVFQ